MIRWGLGYAAAFAVVMAFGFGAIGFDARAEESDAPPNPSPERVPSFQLRDQFNNEHRVEFPRDRPTVLALADRKGSDQLEGWLEPLGDEFGETVHFDGVADVRGVPSLLRWGVRQIFRRGTKEPVMLDWEDAVCTSLAFEKEVANVLVLDQKGHIVLRVHGEANAEELERVRAAIVELRAK